MLNRDYRTNHGYHELKAVAANTRWLIINQLAVTHYVLQDRRRVPVIKKDVARA